MNLYSINTGYFKLDGGAMFGVVPKSIWNNLNPSDENNLCSWAIRSLLIEEGNKLILIDNGMGDKQNEKFFGYYYLHGEDSLDRSLAKHGFHRDDITDVVLTHLHFDHCGGSIQRTNGQYVPAFKNATFWSNEKHWKWATEPNDREKASFLKENILPIQQSGQLQFAPIIENQSFLSENISLKFSYGHTDAMMIPVIKYNNRTLIFATDLLPSVSHIPMPYVMAYDMFPLTTMQEKKIFLNEAVQNSYTVFFQHDPKIECCNFQLTEKGIRQKDVFKLEDFTK